MAVGRIAGGACVADAEPAGAVGLIDGVGAWTRGVSRIGIRNGEWVAS
jgi:hypothetical protein